MLRNLGMGELLVIILIVVLLFGGKKIPELMRGLGSGIREFKKAAQGEDEDKPNAEKKTDEKQ